MNKSKLFHTTLFTFAFLLFTFAFSFAQENNTVKTDTLKTANTNQPNSPQAEQGDVKITDGTNTLIRITDEGTFGAIEIKNGVPSSTTDKLYNVGGTLKFDGSPIGSGGATELDDLTDGRTHSNSIYLGNDAAQAGFGSSNTAIGTETMYLNDQGNNNTGIGYQTLHQNENGNGNIALGYQAGYNETGNNKLYIENSSSNNPLIWGDFASDSIIINGGLKVANKINTTKLQVSFSPTQIDPGYILVADDSDGNLIWSKHEDEVGAKKIDDLTDGKYDNQDGGLFLGVNAGHDDPGYQNNEARENVGIGKNALYSNKFGARNIGIGVGANYFNEDGSQNTMVGYKAGGGGSLHNKHGNVFIGHRAGYNETSDNKLYIENSNSSSPLIWGDFANDIAAINGKFGVGTQSPDAKVTIVAASTGEVALRVKLGGGTKFKVESNGGAAIGANYSSTPANGLYVHGDLEYNAALTSVSDKRFKTNIKPIENAVERIKNINGVYYDWNREKFPERDFTDKHQIGVLAQEIEKEFPELVRTGKDGYKSVDYTKLAPILIEAVKELNSEFIYQNSELKNRIKTLEEENEKIRLQNAEVRIQNKELKKQFVKNVNLQNKVELLEQTLNKLIKAQPQVKVSKK